MGSQSARGAPSVSPAPPTLQSENRARDLGTVLHPAASAAPLEALLDPLLVLSQTVAAALVIGSLMLGLRRDRVQMETIASMMLRVAFIATVPGWKTWALETADAVSAMIGSPVVQGASLSLQDVPDRGVLGPLQVRLWSLGEQWSPQGSPLGDSVAGNWIQGGGDDEKRVAEAWNWAKPAAVAPSDPAQLAWSVETNARRASSLHSGLLFCGASVQLTFMAHYLAETLRLLLFHAGCALAPFLIAGLGTTALATSCARALLGLAGVALWPLAWAVSNAASSVMLDGALRLCAWACSSAMNPKVEVASERTVALAAPYLGWWLLSLLGMLTLCVCLWMLATLVLGPWFLHRLLGAGARWASSPE